jgi:hypothetical protein
MPERCCRIETARDRLAGSAENRKDRMSDTLRRGLLPVLALVALWLAGAGARAEEAVQPASDFGRPHAGEAREAATAPRIYVPLQAAQPHEVEEELAPSRAPTFGDQPPAGADRAAGGVLKAAPVASPGPDPTSPQPSPPLRGGEGESRESGSHAAGG